MANLHTYQWFSRSYNTSLKLVCGIAQTNIDNRKPQPKHKPGNS